VEEEILLVALGCSRLQGILDITARYPFVVFGTMDGDIFTHLTASPLSNTVSSLPVYFYETG
jgi:hypothetical protein